MRSLFSNFSFKIETTKNEYERMYENELESKTRVCLRAKKSKVKTARSRFKLNGRMKRNKITL